MTVMDWRSRLNGVARLMPWGLGIAMAAAAIGAVYPLVLHPLFAGVYDGDWWVYTAAQNQLNWFTTGFMRRELFNTLVELVNRSGADPNVASAIVYLFFYFAMAIVLIWSVARRKASLHQVALAAICVALLFRLSYEIGRSDIAVMLCGLLAAWAARSGRWAIAAFAVAVSLTVYETGMIFLAPLVCAIAWEQRAWRDLRWRSVAAAAAITVVGLGLYVVGAKAQLDVHALSRQVHAQFPAAPELADLALYFNLAGLRTIKTTWCEIPLDPKFGLQVIAGVLVLALLSVCLRPKRWRVTLACVLVPYVFMCVVATDIGRWAVFGVASILALALTQPAEEDRAAWKFAAIAFLGFPLMTVNLASGGQYAPIPLVNSLDRYYRLKTPPAYLALNTCDPGWRQFLGLPDEPAAEAR